MSTDFQYSTDFYGMNSRELSHTCMHLLCLAGEEATHGSAGNRHQSDRA